MKTYQVLYTGKAKKQLSKLDRSTLKTIKAWIDKNLVGTDDPRKHGKRLIGDKSLYWRYRVADYRIIVEIIDDKLVIMAISIAHRNEVYKKL